MKKKQANNDEEPKQKIKSLREIYHKDFMRKKVDKQYLQQYDSVIVLGENFIGKYYLVIFQTGNMYYLLIENIKTPYLVKMKHYTNSGGYHVANKSIFNKKPLKGKLCRNLLINGLHANKKDKESDYPKSFLLHRLVTCLYQNTLGYEIHHINKDRLQNNVCNLVKARKKRHDWIHKLPDDVGIGVSLRMQRRQKRKIYKQQRNTLAQNENLIIEILNKSKRGKKNEKEEK